MSNSREIGGYFSLKGLLKYLMLFKFVSFSTLVDTTEKKFSGLIEADLRFPSGGFWIVS